MTVREETGSGPGEQQDGCARGHARAADEREELASYVAAWWRSVDDLTLLLEELPPEAWSAPTDLAGWDVHAVAAHVAHLEAVLAGAPEETVDVGRPGHVRGALGHYCEQGVVARRDRSPDQLVAEIREAATRRHTALLADPPADGSARPPVIPAGLDWDWRTLLRNRALDVWMHEQDVRRAVGRPGGLDAPGAVHSADYLVQTLGYVLSRKVGAVPGASVRLEVEGHAPVVAVVGEDRRGRLVDPATVPAPDATVATDRESFVLLAGGRRVPAEGAVRISGEPGLAHRVVGELAVTP